MQKIILNDGTKIENVVDGERYNLEVQCTSSNMIIILNSLTESNLSKYLLTNENETEVYGAYTNKKCVGCSYDSEKGIAIFNLVELDKTEMRLKALEDTVDALILSDIGIEESEE